jgi:hypothetical protein
MLKFLKRVGDWNGLEWKKSVFARLEWLGMELVNIGLTGMV